MTDGSSAATLPADGRVCVVATRPDTFAACRAGGYPCPRSYDRTERSFAYMAFYRTAPVSAVTHVAPLTSRRVERRGDGEWMTPERWAALIDPFTETDEVVVFALGRLHALADPVANDRSGVRGAWYCTVGDLRESATLSDLSARIDEA
jgi:hypothetical protein